MTRYRPSLKWIALAACLSTSGSLGAPPTAAGSIVPPAPTEPEAIAALPAADPLNVDTWARGCGGSVSQSILPPTPTATVAMMVFVDDRGVVQEIALTASSGYPELDSATMNCTKKFGRFKARTDASGGRGAWLRVKWTWRRPSLS